MKFVSMLTWMIWVFIGTPWLMAQFLPVVAKQRVVHFQKLSDGSEVEIARAEGNYFRSSSGDVMDTTKYSAGRWEGKHKSTYKQASTRKTYSVDHNGRKATLRQVRNEPFSPMDIGAFAREANLEEDTVEGLHCYVMPITSDDGVATGKTWWASESKVLVKTEDVREGERVVRELYDIQFYEPESSKFGVSSDYLVDETEWNNLRRYYQRGSGHSANAPLDAE